MASWFRIRLASWDAHGPFPCAGKSQELGGVPPKAGAHSLAEERGFPGRDHWSWALKAEWEVIGWRCHSTKVEMILVHTASLCKSGRGTLTFTLLLFQKTILTFENLPCLSYEQRVPWDCAVHNPDYCARALGEPGQKGQEVPVSPATRGTEAGLGGHLSEKVPNPQTLWIQNF